ncbi:hypothetical protein [Pseudomonas syringae]|uniref:hypothetical protein n=1 Tax=Pseudomonas syringae TaxID=317 RepID=UPI00128EB28E|nr:hypothetical protein [Pseudomonas syringae]
MFKGLYCLLSSVRRTSVQVYEWEKTFATGDRLPKFSHIDDVAIRHPDLGFSGHKFAHAVIKAEYLIESEYTLPSIGFLFQAYDILDFTAPIIELRPGASRVLNDFSNSAMAGRIGQGLCLLYAQSLGLKFTAHLRSHVESLPVGSRAYKRRKDAAADFLFTDGVKTILVESKASFSLVGNNPSAIKKVLKKALVRQIDPWMKYLKPTPSNGYVMYSCLREGAWEPSAIFVVDPEGDESDEAPIPFDVEQVMRENYSGWFRAMGLADSASRLLGLSTNVGEPTLYEFFVFEYQGRKFAYPADYMYVSNYPWGEPISGIDLTVLQAISEVITTKEKTLEALLSDYVPLVVGEGVAFSVFSDGSVFGPPPNVKGYPETVML